MNEYSIKVIKNTSEWELFARDWNGLLSRSHFNDIFLTYEWLKASWEVLSEGKLFIVMVIENFRPVGILPGEIVTKKGIRVLQFIGTGHSDYGGYIIDIAHPHCKIVSLIFDYLLKCPQWDVIDFKQIPEKSFLYECLKNKILQESKKLILSSQLAEMTKCPFVDYTDNQYLNNISKSMLKNLRKLEKKFNHVKIRLVETYDYNEGIIDTFISMHIARWNELKQRSQYLNKAHIDFLKRVLMEFSLKGWLYIAALTINDVIASVELMFYYNKSIYSYQASFNTEYSSYYPGMMLKRNIITGKKKFSVSKFDFMRGTEEYKSRFTQKYTTNFRCLLYKKNLKGTIVYFYFIFKKVVSVIKKVVAKVAANTTASISL